MFSTGTPIIYPLNSVKRVRIRSYSGPHSPAFGLNTGKYGPE